MKKMNKPVSRALIVLFAVSSLISCEQKKVIATEEFPKEITNYIEQNFQGKSILQMLSETEGFEKKYEAILDDNTVLEFNRRKEITEIEGNTMLPETVIPAKIKNYVAKNFPTQPVTDWKTDNNSQKIKLNNQMELKFSKTGDFVRIEN